MDHFERLLHEDGLQMLKESKTPLSFVHIIIIGSSNGRI